MRKIVLILYGDYEFKLLEFITFERVSFAVNVKGVAIANIVENDGAAAGNCKREVAFAERRLSEGAALFAVCL